jgi:hypothetical protein
MYFSALGCIRFCSIEVKVDSLLIHISAPNFSLVQAELSKLEIQLSDDPSLPYSGSDVYNVMSGIVSSGCGHIDFFETVNKLGREKVSKMIEYGVLYLRTTAKSLGSSASPSSNVLMATGAPALRAMELLIQNPKFNCLQELPKDGSVRT